MLRFPCLVLDHDDTVVASEASVNYPCFLLMLDHFRPGQTMPPEEFTRWCFDPGFGALLKEKYHFTDEEMDEEYQMWLEYAAQHIPPAFPGIQRIISRQKAEGGLVCVVSHSSRYNILRDYGHHFGIEPDAIFSWEDPAPQRKPAPYPLLKIMERFHLRPDQLLMVDDLKPGCDMAKAAGVPIAYAGWGRDHMPQISAQMRAWSDYAFDTTEDLEQFLFG